MYFRVLCDVKYARHLGGVWYISLHVPLCHSLHHQTLDLRRHILEGGKIMEEGEKVYVEVMKGERRKLVKGGG